MPKIPTSLVPALLATFVGAAPLHAAPECWACARADQLTAAWAEADTVERRLRAMTDSYAFLKSRAALAKTDDEVAAVTRLFGGIYARDYDPKSDLLSLYRNRLKNADFRRVFDEERARLPGPVRDKLEQGLLNLQTR